MSYTKQAMLANMIGLSEQQLKQLILDFAYPIGSIYMQKKKEFDPNVELGGQWVKIENACLRCSGASEPGTFVGSDSMVLKVENLPAHNHSAPQIGSKKDYVFEVSRDNNLDCTGRQQVMLNSSSKVYCNGTNTTKSDSIGIDDVQATTATKFTANTGSNKPFSIIPRSIVLSVWERIG